MKLHRKIVLLYRICILAEVLLSFIKKPAELGGVIFTNFVPGHPTGVLVSDGCTRLNTPASGVRLV